MQRAREGGPRRRRRWRVLRLAGLGLALVSCAAADPAERQVRIGRLAAEPSAGNLRALGALAQDPDRDVRAAALYALLSLDVPEAPRLTEVGLRDPDGLVRATVARLVADRGAAEWAGALAGLLLSDPDGLVRQRAAEALGRFGGADSVPALVRALADPVERVRRAAAGSLGRHASGEATAPLARLLAEDPVWEVRAEAAAALGALRDAAATAALRAALEDSNEFVRAVAARALRERGSEAPGPEAEAS